MPSFDFLFDCNVYSSSINKSHTVRKLISYPAEVNSSARFLTLFEVQRNGDSGSPLLNGSTNTSRFFNKSGYSCVIFFRPPPALRIQLISRLFFLFGNSRIPEYIVGRDTPVALCTTVTPPLPNILL